MNPNSGYDSFSQIDVKLNSLVSTAPFLPPITQDKTMASNSFIEYQSGLRNSDNHLFTELAPSSSAKKFMGARTPNATKQASRISFGLFAELVLSMIRIQETQVNILSLLDMQLMKVYRFQGEAI